MRVSLEVGQFVRPQMQLDSLCVLADLSKLEVEIDVSERDLGQIRIGQRCDIQPEAYRDRKYRGEISWISPVVLRQRGVVRVKVRIVDPDDHLLPDMNCTVVVRNTDTPDTVADGLSIPENCVQREGDRTFVLVPDDAGVHQPREVKLGQSIGNGRIEVRTGLKEGEMIVVPTKG